MKPERRIVSRWGHPALDDWGYVTVPGWILRNYHKVGVTALQMMFISHVMAFKFDHAQGEAENKPRPSLETIAGYMDMSMRQVRRLKSKLIDDGLLDVTESKPGDCHEYNFAGFTNRCLKIEMEPAADADKNGHVKTPTPDMDVLPPPDMDVRGPRTWMSAEYLYIDQEDKIKNDLYIPNATKNVPETPKTGSPPLSEPTSEPKKSSAKRKAETTRKPWSDLTDAMWNATPAEIRTSKPEYHKANAKAKELFGDGITAQAVGDHTAFQYATNSWMWTGSGETPSAVVMTMGLVASQIRAKTGAVRKWIAEGRPKLVDAHGRPLPRDTRSIYDPEREKEELAAVRKAQQAIYDPEREREELRQVREAQRAIYDTEREKEELDRIHRMNGQF